MTESMLRIENAILTKVENNQEYQVLLAQNKTMWDLKNKATGYIAAWAAAVSVATYLLAGFIQGIFTAK